MKYRVDITINGYVEVEANSKEEAREIIEDGYSLGEVQFEDDDIGEISELSPPHFEGE